MVENEKLPPLNPSKRTNGKSTIQQTYLMAIVCLVIILYNFLFKIIRILNGYGFECGF